MMQHSHNCIHLDHDRCPNWYSSIGRLAFTRRRRLRDRWAFGLLSNGYKKSFTVQLGHRIWILYWVEKS